MTRILSLILILFCAPAFSDSGMATCRKAKSRVRLACLLKIDQVLLPPSGAASGYNSPQEGLSVVNTASTQLEDAMQACTNEHVKATSDCEGALNSTMDNAKAHARAMDDLNDVDELYTNGQTNYQNKRDAIIAVQTNLQSAVESQASH